MHKPLSASILLCCFMPLACAAAERSVPAEAPVQSAKRGLSVQGNDYPFLPGTNLPMSLTVSDLNVLAPGVSWYYNWGARQTVFHPDMEFLPMAWGRDDHLVDLGQYLTQYPQTSTVLVANEPNLPGQMDVPPLEAAEYIRRTRTVAGPRRRVVGAHFAAGPTVTDFRNTMHLALNDIGGLHVTGIHTYEESTGGFLYWASLWPHLMDNPGTGGVEGWPLNGPPPPSQVWVKEINIGMTSPPQSETQVIDYMLYAIDLLERDPRVERYAWWKDRRRFTGSGDFTRPPSHNIRDVQTNGALTALGRHYVEMPVHDPDLYYRFPGRLSVARYRNISGFNPPSALEGNVAIGRSEDPGNTFDMDDLDAGEWIDLNIDVPVGGQWRASLRGRRASAGTSSVAVLSGTQQIATLPLTTAAGQYATTVVINLPLAAGRQVLRLRGEPGTLDTSLTWLRLEAPTTHLFANGFEP